MMSASAGCRAVLLASSSLLLTCCTFADGCDTYGAHALAVAIVDSLTQAPTASSAVVRVQDGEFVEMVTIPAQADRDTVRALLALERPGRYSIEVEKNGYKPWSRLGVVALEGRCHVKTVELQVRLVPLAAS